MPLGQQSRSSRQQIRVGGLHERCGGSSSRPSSVVPRIRRCQQPDPTGESPVTTAKPSARYGAMWGARADGFALPSYTITGDTTQIQPETTVVGSLVNQLGTAPEWASWLAWTSLLRRTNLLLTGRAPLGSRHHDGEVAKE